MKTHAAKQEILLVLNTTFAAKEWCIKDREGHNNYFSKEQQFKNACWNGVLRELLPEIFRKIPATKNLSMWQIQFCDAFLELELGEKPEAFEKELSINPYALLQPEYLYN